jgi:cell division protein FtsB
MSRAPRRRGGRGHRERELVQRQVTGSAETPTDPAAATFSLESPDSTSAPSAGAARQRVGEPAPRRRRPRRTKWWRSMTLWTAFAGVVVAVGLLAGGIWAVASLQRDIAVNAKGLESLTDKHNTFAERVRDDFRRVEERIMEMFGARRDAPARR